MPTPTYMPIANITLSSSASSITLSSIPATYRDLIVIIDGTALVSTNVTIAFNSDTTGANYSSLSMRGNGTTASSITETTSRYIGAIYSTSSNLVVNVMDYSAADKHKSALSRQNTAASLVAAWALRWANTSAITSITFGGPQGNFATGTTLSLYGIAS